MALLCGVIWLTSGCAIFGGQLVAPTQLPPVDAGGPPKPSVEYSMVALGGLGGPRPLPEAAQQIVAGELQATLEASGYFSRIATQDGDPDLSLEVSMTNRGNPAALIPAVITGASLYVIPSWATDHFDVVAKVTDRAGRSKEYRLSDKTTLVQWLPMIFFFPTNNFSVIPETRKNIYRNVLSQMKADGFL